MQHVAWLETASQDLDEILGCIEDRNLLAALNLQESIECAASQLTFHPYLYRLGRVDIRTIMTEDASHER